jgi:hypothetical protein
MQIQTQSSTSGGIDVTPLALDAVTQNGIITNTFTSNTMGVKLDLLTLLELLNEQVANIQAGDKSNTEAMLFSQAVTLNSIFLEMSRRAAMNMNDHVHATEAYMRVALKAQNQVRMTLETINNMQNPPVVIAKQANITSGPQQVNNVIHAAPQNEVTQNTPNQLTGGPNELHQDTRTQGITGRINPTLEALGKVYGPQDA